MATVTISTFAQTEATGIYDPDGMLMAGVICQDGSGVLAQRDTSVSYPNWRFTLSGVPANVYCTLTVTLIPSGGAPVSSSQSATF